MLIEQLINYGMTRNEADAYVGKMGKICKFLEKSKCKAKIFAARPRLILYPNIKNDAKILIFANFNDIIHLEVSFS